MATSFSAASLASLSFLCLGYNEKGVEMLPVGRAERVLPLLLSFFDDIGGIFFSLEQLVDVRDVTHVESKIYQYKN